MTEKETRNISKSFEQCEKALDGEFQSSISLMGHLRNYTSSCSLLFKNFTKELIENTVRFSKKVEEEDRPSYMRNACKDLLGSMTTILETIQESSERQGQIRKDLDVSIKSHTENRKEIGNSVTDQHKQIEFAMKQVFTCERNYNTLLKKNNSKIHKMEKMSGIEGTLTVGKKAKQQLKRIKDAQESQTAVSKAKNEYICNLYAINSHLSMHTNSLMEMLECSFGEDATVWKKIMEFSTNMKSGLEKNRNALDILEENIKRLCPRNMAQVFVNKHLPTENHQLSYVSSEGGTPQLDRQEGMEIHQKELTDRWLAVFNQSKGKLYQLETMQKKLEDNPLGASMTPSMFNLMTDAMTRKGIAMNVLAILGMDTSKLDESAINKSQNYLEEDFCEIYATTGEETIIGDNVSNDDGRNALVLFEYIASGTTDISVNENEVVVIVGEYNDTEWCYVKKGDDTMGYVPGSYISPMN